ncbi:MAG TPA: phage holin family protein, partial [Candidatus Caenarcaniphilales bacterium]|nr:phage holin family protein [Candidatus Caenarcaniphilales bacterium]
VAFISLGLTAAVLPGLVIPFPFSLALAVVVIGALSALVRPVLLALVAPFSLVLVLVAALAFQVLVILALVPLVPGVRVTSTFNAFVASWVFAVINSLATWLLTLDSDDSYYAMLVRRLVSRRPDVVRTDVPGLVVIQIDGLAHSVLAHQVRAGRLPVIARWLRSGEMRLTPWVALLPSQTSASQAGIMYGTNDDIPAFRWWDKETNRLFVSNNPGDAARLEQRLKEHAARGGLVAGGASVSNLFSGGAARSYLTMATLTDRRQGLGRSEAYFSFFLSPYAYVHAIVLGLAEVAKELLQARRARIVGVEPRLPRGFPYPLLRALTNVVLRPLCTSLVMEEMLRGTPVVYVDYTDYDEIAHHSGPERAESLDALDGVDRALATLERAAADAPRPYRFVLLSDHGQSLGATFRQRFGASLEDVVGGLMGGPESVAAATQQNEGWRAVNSFLSEVTQTRGATAAVTRRALRNRTAGGVVNVTRPPSPETAGGVPELAVCPSGNLALVFFPRLAGRVSLETLNGHYPDMAQALSNHPGVGLLMVRSDAHGPLAVGRHGVRFLAADRVEGHDPTEPYGPYAVDALRRLDRMANCGDLVLLSTIESETGSVAAFEELIGSHGGLGGPQTDAFLLYPSEWTVEADELVGATALNRLLRRWVGSAPTRESIG